MEDIKNKRSANFDDKTGKKYGRLTVIKLDYIKYYNDKNGKKNGKSFWLCECDCGNIATVVSHNLSSGTTKSCGCYAKERRSTSVLERLLPNRTSSAQNALFCSYKSSALVRKIDFDITLEDFKNIISLPCSYCGDKYSNTFKRGKTIFNYNGIDRINNNKGYFLDNCVPCCKMCNYAKNKFSIEYFKEWVNRLCTKNSISYDNKE